MDQPCVRSGWCCRQVVCPFGTWDPELRQCAHLVGPGPGQYACGIHDQIAGQPHAKLVPAFGAGCHMPLNIDRAVVHLQEHGEIKIEDWPR